MSSWVNKHDYCKMRWSDDEKTFLIHEKYPSDLVSIIIPCHNYGHLLSEAIESVLNQTHSCLEILVVDDDSTDNTRDIASRYPQVKYYRINHVGNKTPARAMNFGIQKARGEYIVCLAADDKLTPNYIMECLEVMKRNPKVGMVWTGAQYFGENKTCGHALPIVRRPRHRYSFFREAGGQIGAMMVRKTVYEQVGLYDIDLVACEDWDWTIRFGLKGFKAASIPKLLHLCRKHGLNKRQGIQEKARLQIYAKYSGLKSYVTLYKWGIRLFNVVSSPLYSAKKLQFKLSALFAPKPFFQHSLVDEQTILKQVKGKTILDCGCGVGRWGELLNGKRDVVGVDVYKPYLKKAKAHEDVILASLTNLPLKKGVFDCAIAVEVIEHLDKQRGSKFLADLKSLVRGKIILTTPKTFFDVQTTVDSERHLSFWTRNEILAELQRT